MQMTHGEFLNAIKKRKANVGLIGLGYVGLPLALRFGEEGFQVLGFDIDGAKTERLNKGESYIKHIPAEKISALVKGGKIKASKDFSRLKECDAVLICVPTPLTPQREPDMSCVVNTSERVGEHLRKGSLVILESTTYPGTTEEVVRPILERGGLKCGTDFYLAFSPEREDPNRKDFDLKSTPKVVGGSTAKCLELANALYSQIVDRTVPVRDTRTAESAKLLENIFRSVNIALVNELKIIFDRMGIDVWEVIEAASTKPFGFMPFYPGPGLGGHCIPIDPFYLAWKAREYEVSTKFIELAGEINTSMPNYVVSKLIDALNDRGKSLKGSKILILGLAYKKDIDDMRESPSIRLIEMLSGKGAVVQYNDPFVPVFRLPRGHAVALKSVRLDEKTLKEYDAVVIVTNHSAYDYEWIAKHSSLVIDTRNAAKNVTAHRDKIVKA
ncbi:MAG: nucleotide sugar dehydrogenase [Deltaproteobacteria bacterium]|nr:nucleotide sugar dehydrogenase [Deltaproteobacteria bacterium]